MNVSFRRQASIVTFVAGTVLLIVGGTNESAAQTTPSNPLRPSPRRVAEPSPVQQAVATEPVRASVHSESVSRGNGASTQQRIESLYQPVTYGKPLTYGTRQPRQPNPGFVPRHAQTSFAQGPTEVIDQPIPMDNPGDMMFDQLPGEGEFMSSDCCGGGAPDCGGCGGCSSCVTSCATGCATGCLIPCPRLTFDNFEFFAGVQGFTGPLNRGETGSFGFHYGANWAVPVPCVLNQPIGMQLGYRGVSSNYSGASFTEDSRTQGFITAGLFRRVDWGLQGGLVVDILHDEWYYDTLELTQLRGELSWVYPQCHELGFWFTAGTKDNDVESALMVNGRRQLSVETYESTDLMAFFYRRRFSEVGGGHGRLFAGFTGSGEGLIGADFKLPLTNSLALQSEFTYLVPKDGNNRVAHLQEAWNVGITLVWYPGCRQAVGNDYFRPLFDVANNGTFIPRPLAD